MILDIQKLVIQDVPIQTGENYLRKIEVTLRGLLIPDEMDADFNTTSILLSTDQETEYRIERNKVGNELLAHIREAVKVTGSIRRKEDGHQYLSVESYQILKHL